MQKKISRQLKKLDKKEQRIIRKSESSALKERLDPIRSTLEKKIPDKLYYTLQAAFEMSFQMLFEKGAAYIEKTYQKDRKQLEHEFLDYAVNKGAQNRYIRGMDRNVRRSNFLNTTFSVLEGGILGFLGIGLPDIPLFIAVVMRNMYEIALSYGYTYDSDEERAFILMIIRGALASDEADKQAYSEKIDEMGQRIDRGEILDIDLIESMDETAGGIAEAMLIAKFIQGIPVVGTIGGVVNYSIIRKTGKMAGIKYKKRYLMKKKDQV